MIGGRWTLQRLVGVGGTAAVYAAQHRNGKRVAIKVLHRGCSETAVRRFLREGYAANAVHHPCVAAVHDDGLDEDGLHFLVMDLVEDTSLEDRRVAHGGSLPVAEVVQIAEQLLDALTAAHERGIIHRDIKPSNLLWSSAGRLTVLDFGAAHLRRAPAAPQDTIQGGVLGTPAYMSPEQARGRWKEVDASSDVWSAGATLFTLLSGRLVHEGETANELLVSAMTCEPPPVREVTRAVPPPVAAVVDKALRYDKANRWQTAREMQTALREAATTLGLPVRPATDQQSAVDAVRDSQAQERAVSEPGGDATFTRSCEDSLPPRPARSARRATAIKLFAGVAGAAALFALGSRSLSSPVEVQPPPAPAKDPPRLAAASTKREPAAPAATLPTANAGPARDKPVTTAHPPVATPPAPKAVTRPRSTSPSSPAQSGGASDRSRASALEAATVPAARAPAAAEKRVDVTDSLREPLPEPLDRRR